MLIREIILSQNDLPRVDLLAIISHVLGLTVERVLMEPERAVASGEVRRIEDLAGARRRGRPLAYMTGKREFFSESFYVDERVLIPRPETETLVEEALRIIEKKGCARAIDMGTGSGVIGVLLAKGGARKVVCADISGDALEVARTNARKAGVGDRVDLVASDLFSAFGRGVAFDLVCANLPYVASSDWEGLMEDVKGYEPRRALVGGPGGAELYERLIAGLPGRVSPGGSVLLEAGPDQTGPLSRLMGASGFEVAVLPDLSGRQRVVRGTWKSSS